MAAPSSEPASRSLAPGIALIRHLLVFSRSDTAQVYADLNLPIWLDPSNADPSFSRNRVQAQVLPVLEELHPGASRRISALAARLGEEATHHNALLALALNQLRPAGQPERLQRRRLMALSPANQRELLQAWLQERTQLTLEAAPLHGLLARLAADQGPGQADLAGPWQLHGDRLTLSLRARPTDQTPELLY